MLTNSTDIIIHNFYRKINRLERIFMKLCAIISEFNPFTNGHEYIIKKAKEETGLDVLCLMSGNFVQRGEPAILDKYARSECAINAGASFILELPIIYALSSAETFANGAVKCLKGLNTVTHLAFGVELENTNILEELAKLKVKESQMLKVKIKAEVKKGLNYNKALYNAMKELCPDKSTEIDQIFTSANNILALEYLTAIYKQKADIKPVYIQRQDNGYNSSEVVTKTIDGNNMYFASATNIRNMVADNNLETIKKCVPLYSYDKLKDITKQGLSLKEIRLDTLTLSALRENKAISLYNYYDYNQGLSHLVEKWSKTVNSMAEIVENVSSRCYRKSRIQKLVLYPLLKLTSGSVLEADKNLSLTVLAVNKDKKANLSKLKKTSNIKLLISIKDYNSLENKTLVELTQYSNNIYNIIIGKPFETDKAIFI